ncbi:hypothetical protein LCI18_015273 [Fusarium solani-melongenae]|uniref:Uncharacterized protein n=1 Tax=Fusarium solani subsp. cucurbitae TaxID=2747967 RepID=A0ACD3ZT59_FUSSC|nr:hypothetical protein LCI18_015273 [Fusarium solani-melongenae]
MTQQFLQGPRSRKPLSSSETRNYRLGAWLHDQYSPWSAAQSSETQGTLQADTIPSIAPPDSPLLSNLPLDDRHNLLGQSLDPIASLGGGDSTVRHHAGSRRASASVTPATHRPTPSPCASNKRKTPPDGNQQDPGKAPNDSPGSGSGGGSASSPSQMKKPKTSDFQYLCPYRQVYHFMDPQRKFRSCQPPGHMKDRSQFK